MDLSLLLMLGVVLICELEGDTVLGLKHAKPPPPKMITLINALIHKCMLEIDFFVLEMLDEFQ